jgi:hypothetical protein
MRYISRRLTKDYARFGSHGVYKRVLCVCCHDSDFDELDAYDNTERERDLVEEVSAAAAVLAVCIIEARKR